MAFSAALKRRVRRRAHFRCCLCRTLGVDIHHILPEGQGGPDSEANAAPLCPNCHEALGANATKRRFIAEVRDFWYEMCEQQETAVSFMSPELIERLQDLATKADVGALKEELLAELRGTGLTNRGAADERGVVLDDGPGESLGDVLQWLYSRALQSKASPEARELLRSIIWDGATSDKMLDHVKVDFLLMFGREATVRLCGEVLADHPRDLGKEGFTVAELAKVLNIARITMYLLTHHYEVAPDGEALEIRFTTLNDLHARARNAQLPLL